MPTGPQNHIHVITDKLTDVCHDDFYSRVNAHGVKGDIISDVDTQKCHFYQILASEGPLYCQNHALEILSSFRSVPLITTCQGAIRI